MKKSITGTAKCGNVNDGTISLRYDKDIVKWFKQFDEETHEIIYMNDGDIIRKLTKILDVAVEESFNDYWDNHYTHFMDFYVDIDEISDADIKKALKGKVFTIKLKVEEF